MGNRIERVEIRTRQDLEKLHDIWRRLSQGTDMTVFQSWEWNELLFEEEKNRFLSTLFTTIYVYISYREDQAAALLPVICQKRSNRTKWFGRKRGLYLLGHESWSDYLNAVYDDAATQEDLLAMIHRAKEDFHGYLFYATDIRENTLFCDCMQKAQASVTKERIAVQVDLIESKEDYEHSLTKNVRQNLRTAKNRMVKDGFIYDLEVMGKTQDETLLHRLTELHIARMKEKNNNTEDLFHRVSSGIRIAYRARREKKNNIITESMKRMEASCLVIVRLNDDIAGYLYGLYDRQTVRIMQNCVKAEYRFYSPMFRGAYDFILSQYDSDHPMKVDFTRGNEKYKYDLGGKEITLFSYVI